MDTTKFNVLGAVGVPSSISRVGARGCVALPTFGSSWPRIAAGFWEITHALIGNLYYCVAVALGLSGVARTSAARTTAYFIAPGMCEIDGVALVTCRNQ